MFPNRVYAKFCPQCGVEGKFIMSSMHELYQCYKCKVGAIYVQFESSDSLTFYPDVKYCPCCGSQKMVHEHRETYMCKACGQYRDITPPHTSENRTAALKFQEAEKAKEVSA